MSDSSFQTPVLSPWRVVRDAVADGGTLLRLLLAFALWFVTACVPYFNIGTTIGLVSCIQDIAKGRPVSPIEIFDRRHRERIVPFCLTLGLSVAAMAGIGLFAWLCEAQCVALFAAAPGAVHELSFSLRRAVFLFAFLPAPLVVGASLSLALPIYLDTGVKGLQALSLSRRLVAGNIAAVLCAELLPAVLGAALLAALLRIGFSVFAAAVFEGVFAVFALAVFGRLYGALRPSLPPDVLPAPAVPAETAD